MTTWLMIAATVVGCYGLKLIGMVLPAGFLQRRAVRTFTALAPVALLAALVAVQTLTTGGRLVIDARAAGLAAAGIALLARAPFLVVVASAVIVTAVLRSLT